MEVPKDVQNYFNLCVAMIVVSSVTVIARFWSRAVASRITFWYDDWTALAAWPMTLATEAILIRFINAGLGKPLKTIPLPHIEEYLKLLYIGEIFFDIAITLPKISAMFFYVRIFGYRKSNNRAFKIAWCVIFVLIVCWWLAFMTLDIAQCEPVRHYWDPEVPGHCTVEGTLASTLPATISSTLIDFMVLILPVPMVWKLNMSRRKRIAVSILIALGYGVVIGSLGRMVANLIFDDQVGVDATLNGYKIYYWSAFEPAMSLIAINIPSTIQLIKRGWLFGLPSLFSSRDFSEIPLRDLDHPDAASGSLSRLHGRSSGADFAANVGHSLYTSTSQGDVPLPVRNGRSAAAAAQDVQNVRDPIYVTKDITVTHK